jgi:uncharacterized membrane protein
MRRPALALAAAAFVVLSGFAVARHQAFRTQMNDLGNAVQAVWGVTHGDLAMTVTNDEDGVARSRLGVHFNLIFYLVALPFAVFPDPRTLLVLGCLASAVAGLGLWAFARRRLGDRPIALLAPAAFFLSPMVHDATLFDFPATVLTTPLFVWMIVAFEAGRPRAAWILFALTLACKEDAALLTLCYGLVRWRDDRRQALVLAGVSLAWVLAVTLAIVPALNHGRGLTQLDGVAGRYRWLGRSIGQMVRGLVTRPGEVLAHVAHFAKLRIVLYLLLSGAVVALGAARWLVPLVPHLAMALLADGPWMTRVTGTFYWVTDVAVIVMACVVAARRPWPLYALAGATAVLSFLLSPLPYSAIASLRDYAGGDAAALARVSRLVPDDAALTVQNDLGAHLATRRQVAAFPRGLDRADHVLVYLGARPPADHPWFAATDPRILGNGQEPGRVAAAAARLLDMGWTAVAAEDHFYLLGRGTTGGVDPAEVRRRIANDARALAALPRPARDGIYGWLDE